MKYGQKICVSDFGYSGFLDYGSKHVGLGTPIIRGSIFHIFCHPQREAIHVSQYFTVWCHFEDNLYLLSQ